MLDAQNRSRWMLVRWMAVLESVRIAVSWTFREVARVLTRSVVSDEPWPGNLKTTATGFANGCNTTSGLLISGDGSIGCCSHDSDPGSRVRTKITVSRGYLIHGPRKHER